LPKQSDNIAQRDIKWYATYTHLERETDEWQ